MRDMPLDFTKVLVKKVMTMAKKTTLADVASRSGVSLSTASLALRNKPVIPAETRQRVLDAARDLGYRAKMPAEPASRLQPSARLHGVGLLAKSEPGVTPHGNLFYAHVLNGIEEACRRRRLDLLYATIKVDEANRPVEMPRLLTQDYLGGDMAEGLLLVGAFVDETLCQLLEGQLLPVVLVDAYTASSDYDAVVSDNLGGAHAAVTYLAELGHRHIGLVGCPADAYPSLRERREGYVRAVAEAGIEQTYFADCPLNRNLAAQATAALLQQHPQITALFCCNDEIALAVMRTAQDLGRSVPQSLSVIGFDDIDLAEHVTPALTTMQVDKVSMGRLAVELLAHRVEFPEAAPVTCVLRPRLIERDSVSSLS